MVVGTRAFPEDGWRKLGKTSGNERKRMYGRIDHPIDSEGSDSQRLGEVRMELTY